VVAKRYLCATEPGYREALSPVSERSLVRQGGPMTEAEQEAFRAEPGWEDAVALRRWDDRAKEPDLVVPDLDAYRPLLERLIG
jgi:gamma-butyrobetaine dioxygenase